MDTEVEKFLITWQNGDISPSPSAALIGTKLASFSDGKAEVTMELTHPHMNSSGTVQGGILCALADVAMGTAIVTKIEKGDQFTTTNLNAMFYRPVSKGKLVAAARVVYPGRTVMHTECDVSANGKILAKITATFAVKRYA